MAITFNIPNVVKRVWESVTGTGFYYEEWSSGNASKGDRLRTVLENPAALFIFLLLPDLASMGRFKLYPKGSRGRKKDEILDHPLLTLLKKPNPMQSEEQFIWDYMFWRMLGCANMVSDSKLLRGNGKDKIYWLNPEFMVFPQWFTRNAPTIFLSDASIEELNDQDVHYRNHGGSITKYQYGMMRRFFDISNGVRGWFDTPSRVDAIYKIVKNSDNALNAKNINSHLAQKFIVAGKHDVRNTATLPMGASEKDNIEQNVMSRRAVHGMKSMVEIKRFLEDLGALEKIDRAYMNDGFIIGKIYGIPRDVIERFDEGSTYENQEKARASVISYSIQPAMEDLCNGILDYFGLAADYELEMDYSHLPFVQTFEKDRADTMDKYATAFRKLVEAGADQGEAAEVCGFQFKKEFREPKPMPGSQQSNGAEDSVKTEEERLKKVI
jgi:hypothetical protein